MPTVKDVIIRKPTEAEKQQCQQWPIWAHGPDSFDWVYTQTETCLIIKGNVTVSDGQTEVSFGSGDLVVFPCDLECKWHIQKEVEKYYNFS